MFAQNWKLFPKNQLSYLACEKDENLLEAETFLMDSIQIINSGEIHYFNRQSDLPEECFKKAMEVYNCHQKDEYVAILDSLVYSGDSVIFNYQNKQLVFKPHCKVGESWNLIKGTDLKISCTKAQTEEFMGITDSIKTFEFETGNFSDLRFKLSENYGLIEYLPFRQLTYYEPQHVNKYKLIGLHTDEISKGYKQPSFKEYFPFEAGDIFYWSERYAPWDPTTGDGYQNYHVDSLKYIYLTQDSVFLSFNRMVYDEFHNLINSYSKSVSHINNNIGKILSGPTSWFTIVQENEWENRIYFTEPIIINFTENDTVTRNKSSFMGFCFSNTWEYHEMNDFTTSYLFSNQQGMIENYEYNFSSTSYALLGSKIKGVYTGDTNWPTSVLEQNIQHLKIHPNPANDLLIIHSEGKNFNKVDIYDISGKRLISTDFNNQIDISKLESGTYFIRCTNERGNIYQQKLIKF